jgi:hypothetical protein
MQVTRRKLGVKTTRSGHIGNMSENLVSIGSCGSRQVKEVLCGNLSVCQVTPTGDLLSRPVVFPANFF